MSMIQTEPNRFTFELPDDQSLEVVVTDEGIILDAYANVGQTTLHLGTRAMTAGEWFEAIDGYSPYCQKCGESIDTPPNEPCGWCGEEEPLKGSK